MLSLTLSRGRDADYTLLCLGAHSDDLEIGCGGTILRLVSEYPRLHVHWIVFSGDEHRAREARTSAEALLSGAATRQITTLSHRDGYFPYSGAAIKDEFELLKGSVQPDLIFTHTGNDAHQDHRLICELTWNTWRDHLVLEYEIPKYDGDLGRPQVYVPVSAAIARQKARHLTQYFGSQRDRHWFTEETFLGLMRLRGMECRAADGYAEAFYSRKLSL